VIFFTFEGLPRCHYSPQLSGESHAHNQAFGGCRRPARIRGFWHLRVGTFGQVSRAADRPPLILRDFTVFAEQPNHPGAAHYLIHSYDSAPLADLGLPAAFQRVSERIPLLSRLFEHALALLVAIIW
jgi:hypothetical protein